MPPRRDIELDALVEILEGKRIIHCHSYRQDEILMLIRVAEDFGFTIGTFQHVLEGYKVADAIAAHGAGASSFSDWWAYKVEVMDAIPHNGALMDEVGRARVVQLRLQRARPPHERRGGQGGALRRHVDPHEALKFVTLNPAKQLRVDHRIGSLETGKDADFAIWTGPPLSTYSVCEQTWIEGRQLLRPRRGPRATVARRARGNGERLTQKLLARAHGAPQGRARQRRPTRRAARIADLTEADLAWLEEQVRLGRDPAEVRPGDCCDGALWHRLSEGH